MADLTWVDADKTHAAALSQFRCTMPKPRNAGGRRLAHPRPWEWEVQAEIHRLKPPVAGHITLLGRHNADIAAVAQFAYQERQNQALVFIRLVAVAIAHRGLGGDVADAMIQEVLGRSVRDLSAQGHHDAVFIGRVNDSNSASQNMLRRRGFQPIGDRGATVREWLLRTHW